MIDRIILNYKIEKLLGAGGMGSVYLASNLNIEQKVAIKVLSAELSQSTIIRQKFKEEAKMLCSLDHPNIVKFLNFVENDEGIFLVMEYVDGITLEKFILEKNGLIIEERVYDLFDQILSGVAYAHKRGIVHRDIKPANIILTPDAEGEMHVKILDFGIAKIVSESNESENGWVVGTPSYMSPEQVNGENIDQRSDIYSLGVLLHQILTGKTPYDTTTLSDVKIKDLVLNAPLPRMKEYYGYISEKMQRIVDKSVEKDIKKRYQNCSEFKNAMKKALRPDPISSPIKYAVAALLVILIGFGIGYWDFNRVKIRYYKDYVEQWGVPQGIGKLSNSEVSHKAESYRFEYQRYKLMRLSFVNSKNKLIEHHDSEHTERPTDMLLHYSTEGKVDYVKYLDRSGKVLFKKAYNDKLNTVMFQYDDEYGTELTLASKQEIFKSSFNNNNITKGKVSRYLLTRDENGYVIKLQHAGFQNVFTGDNDGIYARQFILDSKGRVIEEHYLGYDGTPKGTKKGLAIRKHKFDNNNDWIETAYYTIDGQTAFDEIGVQIVKIEYDKYGNRIKDYYTDSDGNLALRKDNNSAGTLYQFDKDGFRTKLTFFGIDNEPCFTDQSIAGFSTEYDKNGYASKQIYIDTDGNNCIATDGSCTVELINDEKGNATEMWYYDANGSLTECSGGYSGIKRKYDSKGNITEEVTFGLDRQPCIKSDGTAGYFAEYNDLNLLTKLTSIDINLQACEDNNGISIWKREYDKRGNVTKMLFYDTTGEKPTLSNENIAGWSSVYDENGNEVERTFIDTDNSLRMISYGYARWAAKYDEQGNMIEQLYFDTSNDLARTKEGISGNRYKYDDRGNITESYPIGIDGKLANGKLIERYKYDNLDNKIEYSVYKEDNTPTLENGHHRNITSYNERNQDIETRYYGIDGKLILVKGKGYAMVKYEYDNKGNHIQTAYFGVDEKPCKCDDGYSSNKNEYDMMGRLINQKYFDIDGKSTTIVDYVPEGIVKYDKWGNMVYIAAGDGSGNLITNPKTGWAILEREYNVRGNMLNEAYFDPDHKPCFSKDGNYWKIESIYDNKGYQTETRYYNINGELRSTSFAIYRNKYDDAGNRVEEAYFNKDEKPCNGLYEWHKVVYVYTNNKASTCTVYNSKNTVTGKFNRINEEWVSQSSNVNEKTNSSSNSSGNSVKSLIDELAKQCPYQMSDEVELTKAYMEGSVGVLFFRLKEISKYDLSEKSKSEKTESLKQIKKNLSKDLANGSKMKLIINDKSNRLLFEL